MNSCDLRVVGGGAHRRGGKDDGRVRGEERKEIIGMSSYPNSA